MAADLAVLQRAIRALHYTTALDFNTPLSALLADKIYVHRPDRLAEKLVQRVTAPAAPLLLLAGPMGCGKSTELQRLTRLLQPTLVVWCPCDQDLDLHELEETTLMRYVLWHILSTAQARQVALTEEIVRDVRACVGATKQARPGGQAQLKEPDFRTGASDIVPLPSPAQLLATAGRLIAEVKAARALDQELSTILQALGNQVTNGIRLLIVIDGLEKTPASRLAHVRRFLRSAFLTECQSVIVVPNWETHGEDSLWTYDGVEIFDIPVSEDLGFIQEVVTRRAGFAFDPAAIQAVAGLSGGLVRDGLQIATRACRAAADAGVVPVQLEQVSKAKAAMVSAYAAMFSDNPALARDFLREVRSTGQIPGSPAMRDRMLSSSALLPREDGSFRVHPLLSNPAFEDLVRTVRS